MTKDDESKVKTQKATVLQELTEKKKKDKEDEKEKKDDKDKEKEGVLGTSLDALISPRAAIKRAVSKKVDRAKLKRGDTNDGEESREEKPQTIAGLMAVQKVLLLHSSAWSKFSLSSSYPSSSSPPSPPSAPSPPSSSLILLLSHPFNELRFFLQFVLTWSASSSSSSPLITTFLHPLIPVSAS